MSAQRINAILKVAQEMQSCLANTKKRNNKERLAVAITISENYLLLLHAFRVSDELWATAKEDTKRLLSGIKDEKKINDAYDLLENRLATYISTLSKFQKEKARRKTRDSK